MAEPETIQVRHDIKVVAALTKEDETAMEAVGKKQVFVRKYNFWTALAISFCVTGTWEGISAASAQALFSGGPVALLYGYIAAAIGGLLIASSLAELSSAWATSGAIYHWIATLTTPKWRGVTGYLSACLLLGTGWLGLASAASGCTVQIQAYAMVSNPDYDAQAWQAVLIFWGIMLLAFVINVFATKTLHTLNVIGMFLHLAGYLAIIITLLVCTKEKQSASYVFTSFTNYSGWSDGAAWCIGLLSSVYGFVGLETSAYFAEEIGDATRSVPKSIISCVALNAIFTFPFIIVLLFCSGDLDALFESPISQMSPSTQIYINAVGSVGGGIALNSISTIIAFISLVDAMGSGSRSLFAMARDGVFPHFLAKVNPYFDVPVNALIVVTIPPMLLFLIYIGNSTAFYGIMSGILLSMMFLYLVPISMQLYRRIRGIAVFGPWTLGKAGILINAIAVLWACFLMVVLSLPSDRPVTAVNMNYGSIMFLGVFTIALLAWFFHGRKNGYEGPVIEVTDIEGVAPEFPVAHDPTGA